MASRNYVPLDERWNLTPPEAAAARHLGPVKQNGTAKELGLGRNANSIPTALPPIPPTPQQPPPQDGGLIGWLQVLGCFFCWFNSWGLTNAFGVFQAYYESNLPNTPSQISWIGSIQSFLLIFIGVLTGPLFDAGYSQALLWSGGFLVVFGYMMTSICKEYWQIMLAQGVIIGLGSGCLFIPSVAILPQYFVRRRALANGIAASGSSFGGVIYPIIFHQLLPQIGFGWSVRVLAFMALGTSSIALFVLRVRNKPPRRRVLFDPMALKEPPFTLFIIGMFFGLMSLYIPTFYIQSFAQAHNIGNSRLPAFILPILNAGGIVGRILPNFFADRTGPMNMLIPFFALSSVMAFIWIACTTTGSLVVFALIFGFCSGAILSLPNVIIVTILSPSLAVAGGRMGTSFCLASLGLLVGTPVSGAILRDTGSYIGLQVFAAVFLMTAASLTALSRVYKVGLGVTKI